MFRKLSCFSVLILCCFGPARSQVLKSDSIGALELIDTLFIDRDLNNWSVRFVSNYRDLRSRLESTEENIRYVPNNPLGFGLGVASRKLILDFNVTIKGVGGDQTDRFNMLGTAVFENNVFDFFLQNFEGYNERNLNTGEQYFRQDVSSFLAGVNYTHIFNKTRYSITSLRSGLDYQKKIAFSPAAGGFFLYDRLKADSALIRTGGGLPEISRYQTAALGISAGIAGLVTLPYDMFIAGAIMPSAGMSYKRVNSGESWRVADDPWIFMINTSATIGYNGENIYLNLTVQTNRTTEAFPLEMRHTLQQLNAKLAIGYKLFRRTR